MLQALGIGDDASAVYRALLEQPGAHMAEISASTGLGDGAVGSALSELAQVGLVVGNLSAGLEVMPPRPGLEKLLLRRLKELERAREEIATLSEAFPEGGTPLFQIIRDPSLIEQTYMDMQVAAKREVSLFDKPPYVLPLNPQYEAEHRMLRKRISFRVLYGQESFEPVDQPARARSFIRAGQEGRLVPEVPLKAIIIDDETGAVFEGAGSRSPRMVVVGKSGLLTTLVFTFKSLWEQGIPLSPGGDTPASEDEERPVDRDLLALLAAGIKDESIAKQLGVSVRTVRRRIADLLEQLGAHSRFQAGILARTRGLL